MQPCDYCVNIVTELISGSELCPRLLSNGIQVCLYSPRYTIDSVMIFITFLKIEREGGGVYLKGLQFFFKLAGERQNDTPTPQKKYYTIHAICKTFGTPEKGVLITRRPRPPPPVITNLPMCILGLCAVWSTVNVQY